MDQNSVAVKIGYNGELHRLRVDLNAFTLDALSRLFVHTFRLTPGAFVIKYTDAEGDTLNVVSDAEFVEACRVFLSGNSDELKALKFTAVARGDATAAAAPLNPADPLIDAVEKLVQTLNVTVDKVRAEEWKDGVEVATEALRQAATDVKHTLEAARASVQEKPFEAVLEETSDGLKSAASGISSFAQRFVKTFISEKKPEATNQQQHQQQQQAPPAPVAVAVVEEKAEEAPAAAFEVQEEITEAVAVEAAEPEAAVSVPVPVEASVPVVAFSDAEIKWADHLSTVRAIFPDVATATAVESLERNGGDVNVVINELMEEMM